MSSVNNFEKNSKYDVFISYSHADKCYAERVAKRIRRYRVPKSLLGSRRKLSVFRDVEQLTSDPSLREVLYNRISNSDNLVVICSPESSVSEYVNLEIDLFLQKSEILPCLVLHDGNMQSSMPHSLKNNIEDPLFIDLRGVPCKGLGRWIYYRKETLRIIAFILGVDFDTLYKQDIRMIKKRSALISILLMLIIIVVYSMGIVQGSPTSSWSRVPLPDNYNDLPVVPVRDFVVSAYDKKILKFDLEDQYCYNQDYPTHECMIQNDIEDEIIWHVDSLLQGLGPISSWENFGFPSSREEERGQDSANWLSYEYVDTVSVYFGRYDSSQEEYVRLRDSVYTFINRYDSSLVDIDMELLDWDSGYTEGSSIDIISSEVGGIKVSIVSIYEHRAIESADETVTIYPFRMGRFGIDNEWREINIGISDKLYYIIPYSYDSSDIFIVSDNNGVYRTRDGGLNWSEFNLGRNELLQGNRIKPICDIDDNVLYLLVNNFEYDKNSNNYLFMYKDLSLIDRLIYGLKNNLNL